MLFSEVIKNFLNINTYTDLAELYHKSMEVQILVAKDEGQKIESDFKGRTGDSFTNGIETWYPYRIPRKANSVPEDNDREVTYNFEKRVAGIGMTGWDWIKKQSIWVGYDFDAIIGHSEKHSNKLTETELKEIIDVLEHIPWVTIRKSTSGNGLHLYVFVNRITTNNHIEHSALARYILGTLSATAGYDFQSKVDALGGVLWQWHRKKEGTDGLSLIKRGSTLDNISESWHEHIPVISGKKKRTIPQFVENLNLADSERDFLELTGQRIRINFDEGHKKLIQWLVDNGHACIYNQDHHLITTHTYALKLAHKELKLKGPYETISEGSEQGDHNCFSGETEVLTKQGIKKFKDIVNTEQELYVLTPEGMKWIKCPIKSFGTQSTFKIKFGDNYSYRTTYNHQWLYINKNEVSISNRKSTQELIFGKTQLPLAKFNLPDINDDYYEGYAHGFVFGDGWNINCRGKLSSEVALFGYKEDLKNILLKYGNLGTQYYEGHGYVTMIRQLPYEWKLLPSNNISKSYALGFVLGMCASDGNVTNSAYIFQSNPIILDNIRKIGIYAGLRIFPVRNYGKGSYDNAKDNFAITINTYNLTKDYFIRRDQKKLFRRRIKNSATTVNSIDWTNPIQEEVYCAEVQYYHNFTLGNGIITGNCFCFPYSNGSWVIKRFTPGIQEAPTWEQDKNGWTSCFFNRDPDLRVAARTSSGLEDDKGAYIFNTSEEAKNAARMLGVNLELPERYKFKKTILKRHTDGRLFVQIEYDPQKDDRLEGWYVDKSKKYLCRIFSTKIEEPTEVEVSNFDDTIRHLITLVGDDAGWTIRVNDDIWQNEPLTHVSKVLKSFGYKHTEVEIILGNRIVKSWRLVAKPFQPEYPGNREWNRNAPQFKFPLLKEKDKLQYPTWLKLLNHLGKSLDPAIKLNKWCIDNNVLTGADYLKCWVASLFQYPSEPLPYLFFYGPEMSGKSSFHEALERLVTFGIKRADTAAVSKGDFTSELENSIVCVIEDKSNLKANKNALNRIKDWVTSPKVTIHKKGIDPYDIPNTTHWIQTSNHHDYCPVFPGDTRITVIYVEPLEEIIPRNIFWSKLDKEASDFLTEVMNIELPPTTERLNIPVIESAEKNKLQESNTDELQLFIKEYCNKVDGELIKFSEFYDKYILQLDADSIPYWTKKRVSMELPPECPSGAWSGDTNQKYIANICWKEKNIPNGVKKKKFASKEGKLIYV